MAYSSYTCQITHNILRSLKVKLPHEAMEKVIERPWHIYHLICQLTSLHMYNALVLDHCRELDDYTKEKIFEQLDENSLTENEEEQDGADKKITAKTQLSQFFYRACDRLTQLTETLVQSDEHSQQQYAKIQKICTDQLAQWTGLQQQHSEQIKQALEQAAITLPPCFAKKLTELLIHQGITAEIPATQISTLTQFDSDNFVYPCIASALACQKTPDSQWDPKWVDQVLMAAKDQAQQAGQQSRQMLEQFVERIARYKQVMQTDYQQMLTTDAALLELANQVREANRKRKEALQYSGANIDWTVHEADEDITPFSRSSHS